jgi:ribonucleotide reductase alpha subunit
MDLIAAGHEGGMEGDAYLTISGQNSNNSIRISDAFLEAVKQDLDWHLVSRVPADKFPEMQSIYLGPRTPCTQGLLVMDTSAKPVAMIRSGETTMRKIMSTIKARKLWDMICSSAWLTGCPGVQFDDLMNVWNTTPHHGRINATIHALLAIPWCVFVEGVESTIASWANSGKVRYVWNGKSWSAAKARFTRVARTITLNLDNGAHIRLTPEHRVALWDGGQTTAGQCDGKTLYWLDYETGSERPVIASVTEGIKEDVYDFEIIDAKTDDDQWASIAGLKIHNCSEVCLPDLECMQLGKHQLDAVLPRSREPRLEGF